MGQLVVQMVWLGFQVQILDPNVGVQILTGILISTMEPLVLLITLAKIPIMEIDPLVKVTILLTSVIFVIYYKSYLSFTFVLKAESEAMKTATEQIVASHGGAEKVIYVSVHAYSQLWMFPHGHVKSKSPHHYALNKVADKAVKELR